MWGVEGISLALHFPQMPDFSSFPFFLSCCLTPTTFPCSSKPQEGKSPWGAVGSSLSAVPTSLCLPCLWPPQGPIWPGSGFHVSCPTDHSVSFVVEMTSFQKPGGPPLVHKSLSFLGSVTGSDLLLTAGVVGIIMKHELMDQAIM